MTMTNTITELVKFIQIGARLDLKAVALEHILGLTASESGITALTSNPTLLVSLIALLNDTNATIAKDSALCLVNISAKAADKLINLDVNTNSPPLQTPPKDIITTVVKFVLDPGSRLADPCCMILSNLTRPSYLIDKVINTIEETTTFEEIITVFTKNQYNTTGANLHYLGPVLSNLSQNVKVRHSILDRNQCVMQRLLPFTEYKDSLVRRGGVVGTIRNCCFESDFHEWLLSDEVDILSRLLLPLAGGEEFDEEDNDKLPLDLQYLPNDKVREEDPDIRCMLLEGLTQLCTKRQNREFIRSKNAYVVLRELHKWEKDSKALVACENLVDILIRTEDEIGEDNLKEIVIPEDVIEKFNELDANE